MSICFRTSRKVVECNGGRLVSKTCAAARADLPSTAVRTEGKFTVGQHTAGQNRTEHTVQYSQVAQTATHPDCVQEDNKGDKKCRRTCLRRLNCLCWQTDVQITVHCCILHTNYTCSVRVHTHTHVYTFYRRSVEQPLLRIWGKLCISWACEQLLETFWISNTWFVLTVLHVPPLNTLTHSHDKQTHISVKLQDLTAFVRSGAVGSGTELQFGRSRVRFPIVSLEYSIDIILPAAQWLWSRLSL